MHSDAYKCSLSAFRWTVHHNILFRLDAAIKADFVRVKPKVNEASVNDFVQVTTKITSSNQRSVLRAYQRACLKSLIFKRPSSKLEASTDHITRLAGYGSHYMRCVQQQKDHNQRLLDIKKELEKEKTRAPCRVAPLTSKFFDS